MSGVYFRVNAPQVIHESIDGEVIVIHLGTGNYYSLNGSGAAIWDSIGAAGAVSSAGLVDAVAARFDGERPVIETAIGALVDQLRAEELVVDTDPPEAIATPTPSTAFGEGESLPAFEPPRLEKFSDMRDLVLLDPVHEVDATGWPQPRPENVGVGDK
jgi:Coenzyme PQQ synthesis protein D (PqqD)